MKKIFAVSLFVTFMFGILFPVSRTSEGKSPLLEHIKKIFHYSSGEISKKENKGPFVTTESGTGIYQQIRNVFHYFPEKSK
jgi:hypothetical protein